MSEESARFNFSKPAEPQPAVGDGPASPPAGRLGDTATVRMPGIPLPSPVSAIKALPPRMQKGALPALLAAVGLGGGFDALFWQQLPGINVALFTLSLLAALLTLGAREGLRPFSRTALMLVPMLAFFAGMVAIRASVALTLMNLAACCVLFALIAIFHAQGRIESLGVLGFLWAPFKATGRALANGAPLIAEATGELSVKDSGRKRLLSVLRGLLLATPVLILFGALLASADAVFARVLEDIGEWLWPNDTAYVQFWRCVLVVAVSYLVAGTFGYALAARRPTPNTDHSDRSDRSVSITVVAPSSATLGFTEGMVVLGSVTALFTTFVAIQFAYLFGGAGHVLSVPGLTYAEYAHKGFAELNWTAILVLALIAGLGKWTRRETLGQTGAFRVTGSSLLALTLVILASAFQRMTAYEAAYGATELRLYVDGFIVWLGLAIVWFGVTLWRERLGFGVGAFVCALGFAATMNLINPDAVVASRNTARWSQKGQVDTWYLNRLSDDAVPALLELYRRLPAGEEKGVIGQSLRERLENLRGSAETRGWPSAHLSRARALRLLTAQESGLPALDPSRSAD